MTKQNPKKTAAEFYHEIIPPGLKRCPFKRYRKRQAYFEQFCDKERCALWDDRRNRCGAIK